VEWRADNGGMGEIVNLRRSRRERARAAAAQAAAEARVLHGRTAAERARDAVAAERERAAVDGARLHDDAVRAPD
jgi:hypothetical protein